MARKLISYWLVSKIVAVIFVVAGIAKQQEYFSAQNPTRSTGLISILEIAFGIWMAAGYLPKLTKLAVIGLFLLFLNQSLSKAIDGLATCGCFGKFSIHPWATSAIDTAILFAVLFSVQSDDEVASKQFGRGAGLTLAAVLCIVGLVMPIHWLISNRGFSHNDRLIAAVLDGLEKNNHGYRGLSFRLEEKVWLNGVKDSTRTIIDEKTKSKMTVVIASKRQSEYDYVIDGMNARRNVVSGPLKGRTEIILGDRYLAYKASDKQVSIYDLDRAAPSAFIDPRSIGFNPSARSASDWIRQGLNPKITTWNNGSGSGVEVTQAESPTVDVAVKFDENFHFLPVLIEKTQRGKALLSRTRFEYVKIPGTECWLVAIASIHSWPIMEHPAYDADKAMSVTEIKLVGDIKTGVEPPDSTFDLEIPQGTIVGNGTKVNSAPVDLVNAGSRFSSMFRPIAPANHNVGGKIACIAGANLLIFVACFLSRRYWRI